MMDEQQMQPGTRTDPQDDPRVRHVELIISRVLRIGVWGSVLFIAVGTLLGFARADGYTETTARLHALTGAAGSFPRTIGWLLGDLRAMRGPAFIVLGLLLLIATPLLRVAISILAFSRQRDYVFVLITSTVLALLLLSFVLGTAG